MKKLSQDSYEQAKQYLETQARPIDRAVFEFWFQAGSPDQVIAELALFQNPDGGFGNALEPDNRTPSSSAIATGIGLRTLESIGRTAADPIVRNAIEYLVNTFDGQTKTWRPVPTDTEDYPHAPWWDDQDDSLKRTFDNFEIIPRAELVGSLVHFGFMEPLDWLDRLIEETVLTIEARDQLGTGGGDDLVSVLDLAETPELAKGYKQRLERRILEAVPKAVTRDPKAWDSYSIQPLKLAPTPESLAAPLLGALIPANLDYLIAKQTADGAWEPNWTWGDFYPEAWEQARLDWRGQLTVNNLLVLHAWGRIEGQ